MARTSASLSARLPRVCGSPAISQPRSLTRNGTPRNGPSGRVHAPRMRAASNRSWMTALIVGSCRSTRAIASSTSSAGDAWSERTSAARAVASGSGVAIAASSVGVDDQDGTVGVVGAPTRHAAEQEPSERPACPGCRRPAGRHPRSSHSDSSASAGSPESWWVTVSRAGGGRSWRGRLERCLGGLVGCVVPLGAGDAACRGPPPSASTASPSRTWSCAPVAAASDAACSTAFGGGGGTVGSHHDRVVHLAPGSCRRIARGTVATLRRGVSDAAGPTVTLQRAWSPKRYSCVSSSSRRSAGRRRAARRARQPTLPADRVARRRGWAR